MSPKMRSGKAVWIIAAAVMVTALFLIILFAVKSAPGTTESIILPSAPVDSEENDPQNQNALTQNDTFVAITNDNVLTVLQTLYRPTSYHQSYKVTVGTQEHQLTKSVELWVNRGLIHAEVTDGQQKQTLISDGDDVYLWTDDGQPCIYLQLEQKMTVEDILGIPDFDAYLELPVDIIAEADYVLQEDTQVQSIYVCTRDENDRMSYYWINLDNGLLYQADVVEDGGRVYSVEQTGFDLLAEEDEMFSDRFVLPDGTAPFTEETQTQQP